MPPPKGKQGTKGQKQIATENVSTLNFYTCISGVVNAVFLLLQLFVFNDTFTTFYMFLFLVCVCIHGGALYTMNSMARPVYDVTTGSLLDGGIDLNMHSGMSEYMKDLILLTSIVQTLVLISNYFWFILLLIPGVAFWKLWVNILQPWFFAPAPEVDEKKQKKQERKAKRQQIIHR